MAWMVDGRLAQRVEINGQAAAFEMIVRGRGATP